VLDLLRNHFKIIFYCFLVTFFAGYGQSFFIGQFIESIRTELSFSRTEISFVYSLATFIASFNLAYLGGLIDKVSSWKFALITISIIFLAMIGLSYSNHIVSFFFGFYFLRGFGQMILALISSTQIAKLFGRHRGKAQTMASWGKSIGEGVWPVLIVSLLGVLTWRETFRYMGSIMIVILSITSIFLLRNFPTSPLYKENDSVKSIDRSGDESWKWRDVLKDFKIIGLMIGFAILPFVATGIFFQQGSLIAAKGWSSDIISLSYMCFSISHLLMSLVVGHIIDRFTSRVLLSWILLPLSMALFLLAFFSNSFIGPLSFCLLGISVGMSGLTRNTFWAENFGTEHLGRIKGMDSNILVIGTSIAPLFFAQLLDLNISVKNLMIILMIISLLGNCLFIVMSRVYKKRNINEKIS
jgi:MFS family permease